MALAHLTREYSERLGVLTASQLQEALDRFQLGKLLDASPVKGGLFGQNVYLAAATGDYVLRGKPHYDWQFPAEQYFARLIHERTSVPVPWPYLLEESTDLFGWPFAIMPRMPGFGLPNFATPHNLSEADAVQIARVIGHELAKLHEVSLPFCGEYELALGGFRPIAGSYREWITARLERYLDRGLGGGAITVADEAWCRQVFEANAPVLDAPFTPVLVHHDFKRGNVTVERSATGWRVAGVFDLMECYAGNGDEDLVRSMFDLGVEDGCARAFVQAYAEARPLRPGYRERFIIHMLRDALLIWGFEHSRGRQVAPGRTFRQWAEPFVYLDPFTR